MKKKYIIALITATVITILYAFVFTGTKEFSSAKNIEKYDPFFNMLVFPITRYEKGFFTHTFYSRTIIDNKSYDLRFKIDYLNHTVTVEDVEILNKRIKTINSNIARPAVRKYDYSQINEARYFDDIENRTLNLRLLEKVNGIDRKIIITLSDQDLKFTL